MSSSNRSSAFILGICLVIGLSSLGYFVGNSLIKFKQLDRSVTVKGLAQQEFKADIVIWPIQFSLADNDLQSLYQRLSSNKQKIASFLIQHGIQAASISSSIPNIIDKSADQYGNNKALYRYTGNQTVTVYSKDIDTVRKVMNQVSDLGKQGIVLSSHYNGTQYLFTKLNKVKPKMIAQATENARQVAEKFAHDSDSKLGKIKNASQGQFSINARDINNPQIKKVRVVSTIQYYLSD